MAKGKGTRDKGRASHCGQTKGRDRATALRKIFETLFGAARRYPLQRLPSRPSTLGPWPLALKKAAQGRHFVRKLSPPAFVISRKD